MSFVLKTFRGVFAIKPSGVPCERMRPEDAVIVAIADVDHGYMMKKAGKMVDKFPKVKLFEDFRVMFDKMGKEIDACTVAVPDHSHFPIAMLAMSLGKHVYVEKPVAVAW